MCALRIPTSLAGVDVPTADSPRKRTADDAGSAGTHCRAHCYVAASSYAQGSEFASHCGGPLFVLDAGVVKGPGVASRLADLRESEPFRVTEAFILEHYHDFADAVQVEHLIETTTQGPNGYITVFNWILTATVKGNTAPYRIISAGHAASNGAYIVKYVTKQDQNVKSILTLFEAAHNYCTDPRNASRAADAGTDERFMAWELNRFLNAISGSSEVGASTAAAFLIGLPNEYKSTRFSYIFAYPAIRYAVEQRVRADLGAHGALGNPIPTTSDAATALCTDEPLLRTALGITGARNSSKKAINDIHAAVRKGARDGGVPTAGADAGPVADDVADKVSGEAGARAAAGAAGVVGGGGDAAGAAGASPVGAAVAAAVAVASGAGVHAAAHAAGAGAGAGDGACGNSHASVSINANVFEDDSAEDGVVLEYDAPGMHAMQPLQVHRGGDVAVRTPQEVSYAHREKPYWGFNYLEYGCIVDSINSTSPLPEEAGGAKSGPKSGRRPNFTSKHGANHPDYDTHHEQLRSLLRCPQLTGSSAPSYLGLPIPIDGHPVDISTERARAAAAAYYLTILVPWDPNTKAPPMALTWDNFVSWVQCNYDVNVVADQLRNSFIARCRRDFAQNCILGYKTTNKAREAQRNWRNRAADDRNSPAGLKGFSGGRHSGGGGAGTTDAAELSKCVSAYEDMCKLLLEKRGGVFGEDGISSDDLAHERDMMTYLGHLSAASGTVALWYCTYTCVFCTSPKY